MEVQNFGLMNGAYFVSKREILDWVNNTLSLNIVKIEQLGTGAIYCQLIDAYIPDVIPMSKLNWKAKTDYEFIANLKLLQAAFAKLKVSKHIDVS